MLHIQGGLSKFRAFSSCSNPFFQFLTLSRTKPDFDNRIGSILFQAFLVEAGQKAQNHYSEFVSTSQRSG